jgi:hypothetical protein
MGDRAQSSESCSDVCAGALPKMLTLNRATVTERELRHATTYLRLPSLRTFRPEAPE